MPVESAKINLTTLLGTPGKVQTSPATNVLISRDNVAQQPDTHALISRCAKEPAATPIRGRSAAMTGAGASEGTSRVLVSRAAGTGPASARRGEVIVNAQTHDAGGGKNGDGVASSGNNEAAGIPTPGEAGSPPRPPERHDSEDADDSPNQDPFSTPRSVLATFVRGQRANSQRVLGLKQKLLEIEQEAMRNRAAFLKEDPNESDRFREIEKQLRHLRRVNTREADKGENETTVFMDALDTGKGIFLGYYRGHKPKDGLPREGHPLSDKAALFGEEGTHLLDLLYDGGASYATLIGIVKDRSPKLHKNFAKIYEREILAVRIAQQDLQRQININSEASDREKNASYEFGTRYRGDKGAIHREAEDLIRMDAKEAKRIERPNDQREITGELEGDKDYGKLNYGPLTVNTATGGTIHLENVEIEMLVDQPFGRQRPQEFTVPPQNDPAALNILAIKFWRTDHGEPPDYTYYLGKAFRGDKVRHQVNYAPIMDSPEVYMTSLPKPEKLLLKDVLNAIVIQRAADRLLSSELPNESPELGTESTVENPYATAKNRFDDFLRYCSPGSQRFQAVQDQLQAREADLIARIFYQSFVNSLPYGIDGDLTKVARIHADRAKAIVERRKVEGRQAKIYAHAAESLIENVMDAYDVTSQSTTSSKPDEDSLITELTEQLIATRAARRHLAEIETDKKTGKKPQEILPEPEEIAPEEASEEEQKLSEEPQVELQPTRLQKRYSRLYELARAHLIADHSLQRNQQGALQVTDTQVIADKRQFDITISALPDKEGRIPDSTEITIQSNRRLWQHRNYDLKETFTLTYVSKTGFDQLLREASRYQQFRGAISGRIRRGETPVDPATEPKDRPVLLQNIQGQDVLVIDREILKRFKKLFKQIPNPAQ